MGETPKTALLHQIRRSSRSVCANLAEAWRKRRSCCSFYCQIK
ncbi:four helix bundle protein [Scytonema sp. UIC 10036]